LPENLIAVYNKWREFQMPLVRLFGALRQHTGSPQLVITGDTIRSVLQNLCTGNPDLCAAIFSSDPNSLNPHIRIMLNGRDIAMLQGLETPVSESDMLAIVPPIAGGFI
jgi:molybdopterin synthase sulfur carrier subunit